MLTFHFTDNIIIGRADKTIDIVTVIPVLFTQFLCYIDGFRYRYDILSVAILTLDARVSDDRSFVRLSVSLSH